MTWSRFCFLRWTWSEIRPMYCSWTELDREITQGAIVTVKEWPNLCWLGGGDNSRCGEKLCCFCPGHVMSYLWYTCILPPLTAPPTRERIYTPHCRESLVASTQSSLGIASSKESHLLLFAGQPKPMILWCKGIKAWLSELNTGQLWGVIPVSSLPASLAKASWLPGNFSLCGSASLPFPF